MLLNYGVDDKQCQTNTISSINNSSKQLLKWKKKEGTRPTLLPWCGTICTSTKPTDCSLALKHKMKPEEKRQKKENRTSQH